MRLLPTEGGARIEVEGKDLWPLRAVPSDAAVRVTYGPYAATGCELETDANVALRCTSVPGYGKDLAVEVRIDGAVVAHEAGVATISLPRAQTRRAMPAWPYNRSGWPTWETRTFRTA